MPWSIVVQPCSPQGITITREVVYLKAGPEKVDTLSSYKLCAPSTKEGLAPGYSRSADGKGAVMQPFWWALCSRQNPVCIGEGALPPMGLNMKVVRFTMPTTIALPKGNVESLPAPLKRVKAVSKLVVEVHCRTNEEAVAAGQQLFYKL